MNHPKEEKRLKSRVFLSYVLLVILLGSITYFTFSSFRQLTRSADLLSQPNPRIELLHAMIFSIYNAESHIRSYTLSEQESYLNEYFDELSTLNGLVDSLYLLAHNDPFFSQIIDSINIELLNKTRLLDQLMKLRRLDENSALYQQALEEIIVATEESARIRQVEHTTTTRTEPSEQQPLEEVSREKENFFARLRGWFSGRQQEEPPLAEHNRQALQEQTLRVHTDSIITVYHDSDALREELASTIQNLARSMMERQQQIMRAENQILRQDKEVMDNIWSLVTRLEDHERNIALQEAAHAHSTVRSTSGKIFVILSISLIILMVFSWLFVLDINRSRFYKFQLLREKNRAENLLKTKQRFMANISHEIRTPLNSIIGFSRQLEKKQAPAAMPQYLEAIRQSSDHLLHIVNDILDFSKMEAGRIELQKTTTDLEQLCREVYQTLWVAANEKQLEFTLETQLNNPIIEGDPIRIRQILLNIAGNAVKFTPEGSVRISVSDYQSSAQPDISHVHFKVTDTGIGIHENGLQHIFEEFSQADELPTRKFGGTGLGLSISKKLCELMDGKIEVFSKPGEGSTFSVHIPFTVAAPQQAPALPRQQESFDTLSAHILLVEDDRLNRMLFKAIFEACPGIRLQEAAEVEEAMVLMEKEKFDLIITDIQMPGMSGIELIGKLRHQHSWASQSTPALACSADVTPETLLLCKANGIEDIIAKPVDDVLLMEKIAQLLGKNKPDIPSAAKLPADRPAIAPIAEKQSPMFSLEGLVAFTGNNPDTIQPILEAFVQDTRQNLADLHAAMEGSDFATLQKLAHKMITMCGMLQAHELVAHLKSLDRSDLKDLAMEETRMHVSHILHLGHELMESLSPMLAHGSS